MILFIQKYLKYLQLAIIILLSIILLGTIRSYKTNKDNLDFQKNYTTKIETIKDKLAGNIVVQKQNYELEKELTKSLRDSISYFKSISSKVTIETKTRIVKIPINIDRPTYIKDTVGFSYLRTPATFSVKDKWYSFSGVVKSNGTLEIDSLRIENKLYLYTGQKRRSFGDRILFRNPGMYVAVKQENPYTTTSTITNISIPPAKRHNFSLGIGPGVSLGRNGIQPSINAGIYINLINF